jgi:hypothetical protein
MITNLIYSADDNVCIMGTQCDIHMRRDIDHRLFVEKQCGYSMYGYWLCEKSDLEWIYELIQNKIHAQTISASEQHFTQIQSNISNYFIVQLGTSILDKNIPLTRDTYPFSIHRKIFTQLLNIVDTYLMYGIVPIELHPEDIIIDIRNNILLTDIIYEPNTATHSMRMIFCNAPERMYDDHNNATISSMSWNVGMIMIVMLDNGIQNRIIGRTSIIKYVINLIGAPDQDEICHLESNYFLRGVARKLIREQQPKPINIGDINVDGIAPTQLMIHVMKLLKHIPESRELPRTLIHDLKLEYSIDSPLCMCTEEHYRFLNKRIKLTIYTLFIIMYRLHPYYEMRDLLLCIYMYYV